MRNVHIAAWAAAVLLPVVALSQVEFLAKDSGYIVSCGGVEISNHNTERKAWQEVTNQLLGGNTDCEVNREYRATGDYTPPAPAPEPDPEPEPDPQACTDEQATVDALLAEAADVEAAIADKEEEIAAQEQVVADCGTADPQYTQLGPLTGFDNHEGKFMPVYDSPEDGWAMINEMCGPVGEWDHEFVIPYSESPARVEKVKHLNGCIHIKGEPGPNGELPVVKFNAIMGYNRDNLRRGGVFVENVDTGGGGIGVPNDKYFLVLNNVKAYKWGAHGLITSGSNKHMYVEILDSYFGEGHNNHAIYIDNIAFANIQRNVIESPGRGHALRVIAQKSLIVGNKICNIQCDGSIITLDSGRRLIGMPALEIYVNGSHTVLDNEVVHYRHGSTAVMAASFRGRDGINTLDRYDDGTDQYNYLVWGTEEFNDPATWDFPMIESFVQDLKITCLGELPCYGWSIGSTYPMLHNPPKADLLRWWQFNDFPDWETLLAHAHPSWHGTLNLMTDAAKESYLDRAGRGLPHKIPFPVPDGWKQKARITFSNVTGNFETLTRPGRDPFWCKGEIEFGMCVNQDYYSNAEVIIR